LFFDELADGFRMLRTQIEQGLAELVALGLVNSESSAACAHCSHHQLSEGR
jgi:hypothetical protein